MKQLLVVILFCGVLVGCGGGKSGGSGGATPPPAGPSPTPKPGPVDQPGVSLVWGSLPCQADKSCENKVLNIEEPQWLEMLTAFSVRKTNYPEGVEAAFYCGSDFFEMENQFFPEMGELESADFADFSQFANFVLDLDTCKVKPFAEQQMNDFFNKYITGELK